jgi:hypothetical protein
MVTGNSNSRYRQVRNLLGGPLHQADRSIPLAAGWGLVRTGLRAASPRTVVREAVEAGRSARQQWNGVAGLLEAWTTMSGGTVSGAFRGLFGMATTESRALGVIADSVREAAPVQRYLLGAGVVTHANFVPAAAGLAQDGGNIIDLLPGPSVDPESVRVGSDEPGLPDGFTPPSAELPPVPAAP